MITAACFCISEEQAILPSWRHGWGDKPRGDARRFPGPFPPQPRLWREKKWKSYLYTVLHCACIPRKERDESMCNLERDREGEGKWEREESGGNPSEIHRAKFCTHFYLLQEIYIKIHHLSFFGSTSGAPVQQQLSPAKQKKRYLHITNTKCEMHRLLQGLIFP